MALCLSQSFRILLPLEALVERQMAKIVRFFKQVLKFGVLIPATI